MPLSRRTSSLVSACVAVVLVLACVAAPQLSHAGPIAGDADDPLVSLMEPMRAERIQVRARQQAALQQVTEVLQESQQSDAGSDETVVQAGPTKPTTESEHEQAVRIAKAEREAAAEALLVARRRLEASTNKVETAKAMLAEKLAQVLKTTPKHLVKFVPKAVKNQGAQTNQPKNKLSDFASAAIKGNTADKAGKGITSILNAGYKDGTLYFEYDGGAARIGGGGGVDAKVNVEALRQAAIERTKAAEKYEAAHKKYEDASKKVEQTRAALEWLKKGQEMLPEKHRGPTIPTIPSLPKVPDALPKLPGQEINYKRKDTVELDKDGKVKINSKTKFLEMKTHMRARSHMRRN